MALLYHTKNYQGTITHQMRCEILLLIIPYQELSGNYNCFYFLPNSSRIIPYQELSGNYNRRLPSCYY